MTVCYYAKWSQPGESPKCDIILLHFICLPPWISRRIIECNNRANVFVLYITGSSVAYSLSSISLDGVASLIIILKAYNFRNLRLATIFFRPSWELNPITLYIKNRTETRRNVTNMWTNIVTVVASTIKAVDFSSPLVFSRPGMLDFCCSLESTGGARAPFPNCGR